MGLERAGMKTVAFCEIDKHCQKVLKKHWPDVPIYDDVKTLPKLENIDVICGGFPCQDISIGGKQLGVINGKRSSLWFEYLRIIEEVKPKFAIIENVGNLRKNGLGDILQSLSNIGYDAEWSVIYARSVGLPHQRERLFIISYPRGVGQYEYIGGGGYVPDYEERAAKEIHQEREKRQLKPCKIRPILSRGAIKNIIWRHPSTRKESAVSTIRRVTNGIPSGLDETKRKIRIKQLGNSIIPFIAEIIGKRIMVVENKQVLHR